MGVKAEIMVAKVCHSLTLDKQYRELGQVPHCGTVRIPSTVAFPLLQRNDDRRQHAFKFFSHSLIMGRD